MSRRLAPEHGSRIAQFQGMNEGTMRVRPRARRPIVMVRNSFVIVASLLTITGCPHVVLDVIEHDCPARASYACTCSDGGSGSLVCEEDGKGRFHEVCTGCEAGTTPMTDAGGSSDGTGVLGDGARDGNVDEAVRRHGF
jgi:hypothetical protein